MTDLNTFLRKKTLNSGLTDFPGFCLQAFFRGKKIADLKFGKTYRFYDLASLTKIIFTTTYFMEAVDRKKLNLKTRLKKILPWYPSDQVFLSQLLNHSAGHKPWLPFYKKISPDLEPEQSFQQVQNLCCKSPIQKRKKALYSDLDFFFLGAVMERVEKKPLIFIWKKLKEKFYKKSHFHFNYKNQGKHPKPSYAPTENCPWRKKIVTGQVHDENAFAMGGVAPHAGLFGNIQDLSFFGLLLRNSLTGKNISFIKQKTLKQFTGRSLSESRGDWALGFMCPSAKNSSAGQWMNRNSFGHTGFTGTSLWYDPKFDLLVCLVSNRIHPTRKNRGFTRLRPKLHDWIVESLKGENDRT